MTAHGPGRRLPYEQRHAQLVDVAERLFVERGYASVAMEDIARAAGVSRPIVYRVRQAREHYQTDLIASIDPVAAPREQLERGADTYLRLLEQHPGRWKLLFGTNPILPGKANETLAELGFTTIRLVHMQLKGIAPDAPEPMLEAAAHAISGAGERLGHWWLRRPDLDRATVLELYVGFIWDGLAPYVR
jgi:hypothetical protein